MATKRQQDLHAVFDSLKARIYHSCVICGYSFDIIYFNEVVLPILRRKGVLNLVLLIDSTMLDQAFSRLSFATFDTTHGYAVAAMKSKAAFHPKIIQFFGEKEGLASIGSGNPTYGGYGGNLELWFSFHVRDADDPKAAQFHEIWKYIKNLTASICGIVRQKLDWIEEYSKWMQKIEQKPTAFRALANSDRFTIISNSDEKGIYQCLKQFLPISKAAEAINIHSPFYDKNLHIIRSLITDYKPKVFNFFFQPEFTVIPNVSLLPKSLIFYEANCVFQHLNLKNNKYIHAKLIEIQLKNEKYLLIGSPNLSKSAFGDSASLAKNDELGLLIRSTRNQGFFVQLGFKTLKNNNLTRADIIANIKKRTTSKQQKKSITYKYHITCIDERDQHYYVYLPSNADSEIKLELLDGFGNRITVLNKLHIENSDTWIKLCFSKPINTNLETIAMARLLDSNLQKISNRALIHHYSMLSKCNPDPAHRKLRAKLYGIENGDVPLWNMFELLKPEDLINESTKSRKSQKLHQLNREIKEKTEIEKRNRYFKEAYTLHGIDILKKVLGLNLTVNSQVSGFGFDQEEADIEATGEAVEETTEDFLRPNSDVTDTNRCRIKIGRYFRKFLEILDEFANGEKTFKDTQMLFAVQAISTGMFLHYVSYAAKNTNGKSIGSLIAIRDGERPSDYFRWGFELVGRFYSRRMRKILTSGKQANQICQSELIKASSHLAALNAIFIICSLLTIKRKFLDEDEFTNNLETTAICEFFNVLDITERYFKPFEKDEIQLFIESVFVSNDRVDIFDEKQIISTMKTLCNSYVKKAVIKSSIVQAHLNEYTLYYSEVYGFCFLRDLNVEHNYTSFRLTLPGTKWDDNLKDYLSSSTCFLPNPHIDFNQTAFTVAKSVKS